MDPLAVVLTTAIAVGISLGGAWIIRRYAGPAQEAYQKAIMGQLSLLRDERDHLEQKVEDNTTEIVQLRGEITRLREEIRSLTAENLTLRQRLDRWRPDDARV